MVCSPCDTLNQISRRKQDHFPIWENVYLINAGSPPLRPPKKVTENTQTGCRNEIKVREEIKVRVTFSFTTFSFTVTFSFTCDLSRQVGIT